MPWRSASKRTPRASRSRKRPGASSHSTSAAERAHQAAPRRDRVLQVAGGRVLLGKRGGEAALRPVGRGLGERARGDQRHARPLAGRAQRRVQAGGSGADDDDLARSAVICAYGTRVPAPVWLRHDAHLAHDIPGHPERPQRIRALEAEMSANDWFGCERVSAPAAERELLLAVHPESHVAMIEALSASGGGMIDMDTTATPGTYEAAVRAAGGAAALVDALLGDGVRAGVSAMRPPGHHAETARAMGFCFFGNAAIAARRAQQAHGAERVLILDWDVHHGNGTNEIFHEDPSVLFVSIHEWPLYPGTGPAADLGVGEGEGYTVNLPVPGGSGDACWRSLVEHVGGALITEWRPDLVLVSAGFDAHRDDPLADCRVSEAGFAGMTASLRRACDAVGAPLGLVLEGGYDLGAIAHSMAALMPVLVAESASAPEALERHPLAVAALERLRPWWPAL